MKAEIVCPVCREPLSKKEKSWYCKNGHCFDEARNGLLNLARRQKAAAGDDAAMAKARSEFLETGAYGFLEQEIEDILKARRPENWLDLGCGEGWYTRQLARFADHSFGVDLSRPSLDHALRQDDKTRYLVSSIFDLPFAKESMDMLTSIFTPIPAKEASRLLKPDGQLVVVTPGVLHHYELKQALYPQVRLNDEPKDVPGFVLKERREISQKQTVSNPMTLLDMTPYRWKCSRQALEKFKTIPSLDVTFDFVISVYEKEDPAQAQPEKQKASPEGQSAASSQPAKNTQPAQEMLKAEEKPEMEDKPAAQDKPVRKARWKKADGKKKPEGRRRKRKK